MKNLNLYITIAALLTTFSGPQLYAAVRSKISMKTAKAIAMKKVPGTIKSSEYEHEQGADVYSFDILGKDSVIHEVLVNAHTGKIISTKVESAAQEAKEATEKEK